MRRLLVLGALCFALPAHATRVKVDLNNPGDARITRDSETSLGWLGEPLTDGMSYEEIMDGAGGWIPGGWRYATTAEVCALFSLYALDPTPCPGPQHGTSHPLHVNLVAHLGQTISTGFRAIYYDGDVSLGLGIAELWGSQDSETALVRDDMVGLSHSESSPGYAGEAVKVQQFQESAADTPFREPAEHHGREICLSDYKRTNHTEWDCKYHIIFIPKYRKKVLYGKLRDRLGGVFRQLAHQKESEVEEGHLRADHVHMMLSIPPKYSVATVVGFLKGKSAIWIARNFGEATRGFIGKNFWARGYFVSTVGRDEEVIRNYIQRQEMEDRRIDQLGLL